jgi:hypothetical protein
MKFIKKLITSLSIIIVYSNANATGDITSAVTLMPNPDGYKLKYITSLSDLPIIDNKWYPDTYEVRYRYDNKKHKATREIGIEHSHVGRSGFSPDKYFVTSDTIYAVQVYVNFTTDKDGLLTQGKDEQLRLCNTPINSTKWDCSLILGFSDTEKIIPGKLITNDENIAVVQFTNEDRKEVLAIANKNKILKLVYDVPYDLYRGAYYKNSKIYKPTSMIDLDTKSIYEGSNVDVYNSSNSCIDQGLLGSPTPAYYQNDIYSVKDGQLYYIMGSYKTGYKLGSKIGSPRPKNELVFVEGSLSNGELIFTNTNMYINKMNLTRDHTGKDGQLSYEIAYNSILATPNQPWKPLTIKVNGAIADVKYGNGWNKLIRGQNNLYLAQQLHYDNDKYPEKAKKGGLRGEFYLYEISK